MKDWTNHIIGITTSAKNSFDLVKKINGLPLQEDYQIVSFDILSMYSNIPN